MFVNFTTKHIPFTPSATIKFADRTTVTVPASKIGLSNTRLTHSGESSGLPVGVVLGRTLQLELVNDEGQWNNKDFFGAIITLKLSYGGSNSVTFGYLTVTEPPESLDNFIVMTAVDNTWRLDKPYNTKLTYPASVNSVWSEICSACGLSRDLNFPDGWNSCVISEALTGDYTYRQVAGFIAGLFGCFVDVHPQMGMIRVRQWTFPTSETALDDTVTLDNWITLTPALHDIKITGISAKVSDAEGKDTTYTAGTTGYIIQLPDNPLLTSANVQSYLAKILTKIGNIPIRTYSGEAFFYPALELGDAVKVITKDGDTLYSVVTDISWSLGGKTSIRNRMEAPTNAGSTYRDPAQKALIEARKLISKERSDREQAIINLQEALANASGLYETAEVQQDGSTIYYLHDKSKLSESTNVIKLTSEALALSTDGGQTYPYGLMINGDVVARILAARGISADWINTGAFTVKDLTTQEILFSADVAAGTVFVNGMTVTEDEIRLVKSNWPNGYFSTSLVSGMILTDGGGSTVFKSNRHETIANSEFKPEAGLRIGNYVFLADSSGGLQVLYSK